MTLFILICLLVCLVVLAILIQPLLKTRQSVSYKRHEQNIHYAKERLQELGQQLKNTTISATDYEALRLEIENSLLKDLEEEQAETQEEQAKNGYFVSACLIVSIILGGFGLYNFTGTPAALKLDKQQAERPSPEQIDSMLSTIEERLKQHPEDLKGWSILANSYMTLGRYPEAIKANQARAKLIEGSKEKALVLAQIADASALRDNGLINAETADYIQQSLTLDQQQPQALWLAGLHAVQQGQPQQAQQYWQRLLPLLDDSPKQQQELREIIKQTAEEFADTDQTAETPVGTNSSKAIKIQVSLDNQLQDKAQPDDVVFVIATAKNGPKAPLAVKRLKVSELPATVTLSDSDAMLDKFKLSLFKDIVLSARVAKSGQPTAQSGDLQSNKIESTNDNRSEQQLLISQIID